MAAGVCPAAHSARKMDATGATSQKQRRRANRGGSSPRERWTMYRIVQTIAGKDGVIRQADVRLPTGKILRRPVVKLVILESENPAEGNAARYDADRAGDVADRTDRED